jgi:hypothetical protein
MTIINYAAANARFFLNFCNYFNLPSVWAYFEQQNAEKRAVY